MTTIKPYKNYIPAVCAAVVLYALFALLTFKVAAGVMDSTDFQIEQSVYSLRSPGLNTLVEMITYCGNTATIIVVTLLLLAFPRTRVRYGLPVLAADILTTIIKVIVKNAVERPRPDKIYFLISQGGFSYPSGHAITSIAVYGILAWLIWFYHHKKFAESPSGRALAAAAAGATDPNGAPAPAANLPALTMTGKHWAFFIITACLSVCIGLSRIYVGVHHPTDILGGFLAGSATAILILAAVHHMVMSGAAAKLPGSAASKAIGAAALSGAAAEAASGESPATPDEEAAE